MAKKKSHKSNEKHKSHHNESKDNEDTSFELKGFDSFNDFYKRYIFNQKSMIFVALILIICMGLAFNIRMTPADLPATEDWATSNINSMLKNQLSAQINKQYPNLPDDTKEEMISTQLKAIKDGGSINVQGQDIEIEQFIQDQSDYFKQQMQAEEGNTYLLAIDPYFYYRYTKNYLETGNEKGAINDEGEYYDPLVLAGTPIDKRSSSDKKVSNLHIYVNAWTYKVMKVFNKDITLMGAVFYVPVLIATLCVIPIFFITRKIIGNYGGLFAGILMALHPAFLNRTAGGFSDTDAYNLFFPLFALWFMLEAMESKDIRLSAVWAGLSGLSIGLFSYVWNGWKFIFFFIFFMIIGYLGYQLIVNREFIFKSQFKKLMKIKNITYSLLSLGVMTIVSAISVITFKSINEFAFLLEALQQFTEIKLVGVSKIWPNVYTTVAELNPANLSATFSQISMGSKVLLFLSFAGIALPLIVNKKKITKFDWTFILGTMGWYMVLLSTYTSMKNQQILFSVLLALPVVVYLIYSSMNKEIIKSHYSLILLIWFVGTIYASSKGVRFVLLLVPAFSIAIGISAGYLYKILTKWISKNLNLHKALVGIAIGGLLLIALFTPVNVVAKSFAQSKAEIPSMNDQWYATLTKIKEDSNEDAIINSWWDFGHWFAAIAERPVTLDGGRQNSPQAHWLGNLMLTWDENESVGILRYLDCGGNVGFDEINRYYHKDGLKAINTLYEIIPIENKDEAESMLLQKGIAQENVSQILQYTHCQPPANYFITSGDMVGKSGVWAHFGAWDFEKATMFNKVYNKGKEEGTQILKDDFGMTDDEADNMFNEIKAANADQWISPWPSFITQGKGTCQEHNETTLVCSNGVVIDYLSGDVVVMSQDGKYKYPKAAAYINKEGEFTVKEYDKNLFPISEDRYLGVAVYPEGSTTKAIMMDSDLTASIFTRLFFYENVDGGLKHFEKFYKTTDVTGNKIIVWKINWDGIEEVAKEDSSELSLSESVFELN